MKLFQSFLLIIISTLGFAQNAPNYYNGINFNLEGNEMKEQLSSLITSTHNTIIEYGELWDILKQSDLSPTNSNKVMLIYGWNDTNAEDDDDLTRNKQDTCGNGNACTDETWNREHVFPKGLDNSSSNDSGPTADPHMIRASDVEMNGFRGNHLFGEGNGVASYLNGEGNFYPGDNWKGDVARIIMYMFVSYGFDWNPNYTGAGSNTYHTDMPDIFLEWNAEDPVSTYEMNRNDIVSSYQGNRNPFIDNPYLATVIWGGPAAENTWPDTLSNFNLSNSDNTLNVYPNPTKGKLFIDGVDAVKKVEVYNMNGQLQKTFNDITKLNLDTEGAYLVRIFTNNKVYTRKVIRK